MASSSGNLQTASHYVNNLLLSRGLLRNGVAIEFVNPSKGDGGKEATMAKIINLVHDMVLRRDRETETTNSLSQALQAARASSAHQAQSITRLEARNSDLERQLSLSNSQMRTAQASLKVSETRHKALREDMTRLRATVGQIRAQCANDLRKRDAEMGRLKRHLDGRRGRDNNAQVGLAVITPGVSKPKSFSDQRRNTADLESPSYSLKEETTEFLTQLSQTLSDENDALIGLVQTSLDTLRELQGLQIPTSVDPCGESGSPNIETNMPPSYESLASGMDEVMEHLRCLLTNPSFVPLEEVQVREEEIMRLREGFEKMEARWREAVSLMGSWRKRMMETGDTINLDDLRRGLNLDSENFMPSSDGVRPSTSQQDSDESSVISQDAIQDESKVEQELAGVDISPVREMPSSIFPAPKVLQSTSGNARALSPSRKPTYEPDSPKAHHLLHTLSDADDDLAIGEDIPRESSPSPRKKRKSEGTECALTVQEKLKKAEEDAARAAEVRQRVESRSNAPIKRTAIPRKIKSKRRSTLSPEELDGLMGIS